MTKVFCAALSLFVSSPLWACAVCFRDPESKLTQGLQSGVLVLLAFIASLLVGFGLFFLNLRNRALEGE